MQTTTQLEENKTFHWGIGLVGAIIAIIFLGILLGRYGLLPSFGAGEATGPLPLKISAEQLSFGQERIKVQAGQPIELELDNADFVAHSFDVDELDIHVEMPINQTVSAELKDLKPGSYTFYCAVPGHVEAGMVGTLVVEE